MASRKVNALERRLHQAALADPKQTLTQKQLDALAPDAAQRTNAVNFLLAAGMLRPMKNAKGVVSFRAVTQEEMNLKRDLGGEENLVLSHISAAANEGIWSKHLKGKTELHKTVLDRCIKSLLQKHLIKAVRNVKKPTQKMYMLSNLEPSAEMTGGPWYTDNELDAEFISRLLSACLSFIRSKTLPKAKSDARPLYSISAAPVYPSAQHIQAFLSKSNITDTKLEVEHVEMLLNILVIDGAIEKIPAFGGALWDAKSESDSEDEEELKKKRKRKHDVDEKKRQRKRKKTSRDSKDEEEDDHSDTNEEEELTKKRRKKRNKDDSTDEDTDGGSKGSKKKSKHKRRKAATSSSESASSDESKEESDSDDDHRSRKRKKTRKHSSSPAAQAAFSGPTTDTDYGGAYVFRAIRQERVALGWSQAPCARCPVFDFCNSKGPVNSRECEYYSSWLGSATVQVE